VPYAATLLTLTRRGRGDALRTHRAHAWQTLRNTATGGREQGDCGGRATADDSATHTVGGSSDAGDERQGRQRKARDGDSAETNANTASLPILIFLRHYAARCQRATTLRLRGLPSLLPKPARLYRCVCAATTSLA